MYIVFLLYIATTVAAEETATTIAAEETATTGEPPAGDGPPASKFYEHLLLYHLKILSS